MGGSGKQPRSFIGEPASVDQSGAPKTPLKAISKCTFPLSAHPVLQKSVAERNIQNAAPPFINPDITLAIQFTKQL